jgi:hypothetical protein
MNGKMSVIIVALVLSMLITPGFAKAIQEENQILINASGQWSGTWSEGSGTYNIYDYGAKVYGNYIVWTRAVDLNRNGAVYGDGSYVYNIADRNEPSWIMLHNTNNESSTIAITPTIDDDENGVADVRTGSGITATYFHAQTPNICEKQVIYVVNYGNYNKNYYYRIDMYNISFSETWTLPLSYKAIPPFTPAFYGDYIIFGESYWDGVHSNILPYLYNWVNADYAGYLRPLYPNLKWIGYNYILTEDYAISTGYDNTAPSVEYIMLYKFAIGSEKTISITESSPITSFYADSMYEELIGITTYTAATGYDTHIVDFSFVNWSLISTVTWDETEEYRTTVANTTQDERNIFVWDNYVCYNSNTPGYDDYNIYTYSISKHTTQTITASSYPHIICDFKGDKIVYSSNAGSYTQYGDARDDFDIYRTQTELESVGDVIWAAAPFILTIMVMGVIFGALKMFGDSSG